MYGVMNSARTSLRLVLSRAALAGVAALWCAGCKPAPLPGEPNAQEGRAVMQAADRGETATIPLARVNGREITLDEVERRLAQRSVESQRYFADADMRPQFLEMLLWIDVMATESLREGWTQSSIAGLLEDDYRARALLAELAPASLYLGAIADADVAAAWEAWEAQLLPVARRRVSVSLYADRAGAEDAWRQLDAWVALEHDTLDELFAYEARAHSQHEATRSEGGALGWVAPAAAGSGIDPAFEALVFGLEEPGIAGILDTPEGALLVYVAGMPEVRPPSFEDAEPWIRGRLLAAQRAAALRATLDAQRQQVEVSIDAAAVASLRAARVANLGEAEPARRYRRFSEEALAGLEPRAFGRDWNSLATTADAEYRINAEAAAFRSLPPAAEPAPALPESPEPN